MKSHSRRLPLIVLACFMAGVVSLCYGILVFATSEKANIVYKEDRAEYLGYSLFKGHMHTHTSLSDGILLPNDAYNFVKANTDFDFYAVTEHDVTYDISTGSDFITNVQDSYSEEYKLLHEQSDAHNRDNEFITLPGTEVTWYDEAGHINLFNTAWFARTHGLGADGTWGWSDIKYDLPTFYARLAQDPNAIAQFNHPRSSGNWSFSEFKHYNRDVDKNLNMIEYKSSNDFAIYTKALDRGWHISPVFGGDEHKGNWGMVQPHVTGIWADDLSREGLYEAMRNHRTYVAFDRNLEMAVSANGQMMGAILPADTNEIDLYVRINDPDTNDYLDKVVVYKNSGEVVKEYQNIASNQFEMEETFASADGDYFIVRAFQADGEEAISAPIWIGDETRGTVHAPEITVQGEFPGTIKLGDHVEVLGASATDNSGQSLSVEAIVLNDKGEVAVVDQHFSVDMYGEYFIKYSATDHQGNTRVELIRLLVDQQNLDTEKILNEFQPIVNLGANEHEVGINLVTDKALETSYVQYKPESEAMWDNAEVVQANVSYFQVAYGDTFAKSNYRVLAAHEADLTGLDLGAKYDYRYGISPAGPWSSSYSFKTASSSEEAVMYVMGDLEVPDRNPESFRLFNDMLDVLQEKNPNGQAVIQVGDLAWLGGNIYAWDDVFNNIYNNGLELISAHIVGDRERVTERKFGAFSGFFNLPKNGEGSYRETNYSFNYGEMHIAVLNSVLDFDKQLQWLEKDLRATDKKWKIVMGHYPYYGGQSGDETGMNIMREKLSQAFERLGVSLYIGGHDHVYKRTTIRNGVKDISEEAMNLGTTFVTVGSSGPTFYDNKSFDWDHIVYDAKKQTGVILESDDQSLTLKAYNSDGVEIDSFTIEQPENYMNLTSAIVENNVLKGVGVLNYPNSLDRVTIIREKRDHTGEQLLETVIQEATLEHLGREQIILFDSPLAFGDENTIIVRLVNNPIDREPLADPLIVKEGMLGDGSEEDPYQIKSTSGLYKMHEFPDKHYILDQNIDGNGVFFEAIGANETPFTGTFDGQGHTITGVIVSSGGAGLFAINEGTIRNVGIINADIDVRRSNVGILVDQNDGIVEYVYSTGSIRGNSTVGGLVGFSNGVVRNSYSTARVSARGKQAGGIIGITNRGSITEQVYAMGSVTAEESNAGGISGYGYNNTVIQNSIALNPSVVTGTASNRIVGRVLAGDTATLVNNYADENMFVSSENVTVNDPNNEKGQGVRTEAFTVSSFFVETLGWDFDSIWIWDEDAERPLLQSNLEEINEDNVNKPKLNKNEDGYYIIRSINELKTISEFPNENYILENDLDFEGKLFEPLFKGMPFLGVFNGNNKSLYNFNSENGGLFHLNGGTIKNIAMVDASVVGGSNIGVLVNTNNGKVENSYVTGSIEGISTVGGLVGYSNGIVRNSYSTANVTAQQNQAGGLIGITNTGSLTENVYVSGAVQALKSNAGGVTGYGYNDTVVRNVIALNPSVVTPTMANRVVGRVLAGHTATLENNYAFDGMKVDKEGESIGAANNRKGLGLSQQEVESPNTYTDRLKWDFESVWMWDNTLKRPVLSSNPEEAKEPVVPLERNEAGYYKIKSIADLNVMELFPAEKFILENDLDYSGQTAESLFKVVSFTGVFDGGGKKIYHFNSSSGGLFHLNGGVIKNIAMIDASVTGGSRIGILINTNNGELENSLSTGSITGTSTVGGLVGYSNGIVRNSYSTADVTAQVSQAGGLIGITNAGSLTENVYASGIVKANTSNAGGVTGYGYNETVVRNVIALNPSVTTPTMANRVMGRVLAGNTATLENNYAFDGMIVNNEGVAEGALTSLKGLGLSETEVENPLTYTDRLGWDFNDIWLWDDVAKRPVLRSQSESELEVVSALIVDGGTITVDENAVDSPAQIKQDANVTVNAFVPAGQRFVRWVAEGLANESYTANPLVFTMPANEVSLRAEFENLNVDLFDLKVDGSTVSGFSADTTSYTVNVPNTQSSVTVEATAADANAVVVIAGGDNLAVGDNTVTVTITADDGEMTKVYTIIVNRAAASGDGDNGNGDGGGGTVTPSDDSKYTLPAGAGGTAKFLNNAVTIIVPAGASEKQLTITVEKVLNTSQLVSDKDVLISPVYEILKNFSENFKKPITLTLTIEPSKIGSNQIASIFYYDEAKKIWVEIGGKVSGDRITAEIDHFTKFAVFALDKKDEENPENEPEENVEANFTDIAGHWAEASIKQAAVRGIIGGYTDGAFRPNGEVTRAEFAVMLARMLKLQGNGAVLEFTDKENIGAWAKQGIAQVVQAGIVNGYADGSFRPNKKISRAEMVTMIANALGIANNANAATAFADDTEIPLWAKSAVNAAMEKGIVQGVGGNRFAPNKTATRAEAAIVLLKALAVVDK